MAQDHIAVQRLAGQAARFAFGVFHIAARIGGYQRPVNQGQVHIFIDIHLFIAARRAHDGYAPAGDGGQLFIQMIAIGDHLALDLIGIIVHIVVAAGDEARVVLHGQVFRAVGDALTHNEERGFGAAAAQIAHHPQGNAARGAIVKGEGDHLVAAVVGLALGLACQVPSQGGIGHAHVHQRLLAVVQAVGAEMQLQIGHRQGKGRVFQLLRQRIQARFVRSLVRKIGACLRAHRVGHNLPARLVCNHIGKRYSLARQQIIGTGIHGGVDLLAIVLHAGRHQEGGPAFARAVHRSAHIQQRALLRAGGAGRQIGAALGFQLIKGGAQLSVDAFVYRDRPGAVDGYTVAQPLALEGLGNLHVFRQGFVFFSGQRAGQRQHQQGQKQR